MFVKCLISFSFLMERTLRLEAAPEPPPKDGVSGSASLSAPGRLLRTGSLGLLSSLCPQDLLRCRVLTSGIFETRFQVDKVNFQ